MLQEMAEVDLSGFVMKNLDPLKMDPLVQIFQKYLDLGPNISEILGPGGPNISETFGPPLKYLDLATVQIFLKYLDPPVKYHCIGGMGISH